MKEIVEFHENTERITRIGDMYDILTRLENADKVGEYVTHCEKFVERITTSKLHFPYRKTIKDRNHKTKRREDGQTKTLQSRRDRDKDARDNLSRVSRPECPQSFTKRTDKTNTINNQRSDYGTFPSTKA